MRSRYICIPIANMPARPVSRDIHLGCGLDRFGACALHGSGDLPTPTREVVIFTDAHWTTGQRQIAVGTILQLAGVPDDDYWRKVAAPRPKDRNA